MSNFNARIKLKRDTAVNWTVNNPVLLNGEIILIDTDSGELRAKVGDGTKTYTQLPFTDEILRNLITNKQNKLTGTQGQIVGFDEDGNAIAQDKPILYVNITTTDDENFTSDKTAFEIKEAVEQGYSVIAEISLSGMIYTLDLFYIAGETTEGTTVGFSGAAGTTAISAILTSDTTLVEMETTDLQSSIKGTQGQVVGFDSQGKPIAQNDKSNTAIQLDYENMKSLHELGITDLNNVIEPGTYVGMSNGTTYPEISNIPSGDISLAFYLEVHRFIGPSSTDFEGYTVVVQHIYSMLPIALDLSCGYVRYGYTSIGSEGYTWSYWNYFALPFIQGTPGQVIGFNSSGIPEPQDLPSGLPEGGTDGKILGYGSSGPQWIDAPKTASFVIQSSAPSDTSVLWINSTEHTLNYWDGSAWVKTVGVWG